MKIKSRFGVTILELVIVVAVLGILGSAVTIIIGRNSQGKTRDAIRKSDLKAIGGAVNAYYFSNNNQFPAGCDIPTNTFCTSTLGGVWIPLLNKEMKIIPLDPLHGTVGACPYRYETTADRQDFVLWGCLEVSSDEHIWNKATAPCGDKSSRTPPVSNYNFCFDSR